MIVKTSGRAGRTRTSINASAAMTTVTLGRDGLAAGTGNQGASAMRRERQQSPGTRAKAVAHAPRRPDQGPAIRPQARGQRDETKRPNAATCIWRLILRAPRRHRSRSSSPRIFSRTSLTRCGWRRIQLRARCAPDAPTVLPEIEVSGFPVILHRR
jgi:hypothetical protein